MFARRVHTGSVTASTDTVVTKSELRACWGDNWTSNDSQCKLGGSYPEQLGGAGLGEGAGEGRADACRVSRSLLGREKGKNKTARRSSSSRGRQETSNSSVWANLAAEQEREEQRRPQTVGGAGSLQTLRQAPGESEGPVPEATLSSPWSSLVQPF